MTRTILSIATLAMLSTAAMAKDFDNTGFAIKAQSDLYGIELQADDSDRVIELTTAYKLPVTVGVAMKDNSTTRDFAFTIRKKMTYNVDNVTLYIEPKIGINTGDSYAKNQFELSPTIGASFNGLQYAKPYVELEGKNVSTSDDPFDISGANKYATIGAIVPLATTTDLDLSMVRTMDGDWSKTDNEIMALVVFKF
jgi:hypothetical protein|tara:strand:- start:166 stop:753 length:588 start_codon:yes stop_codon:yes gene_type:complete